jgi:PTS system glucitol/sorbitol-specific IIC component
MDAMNKILVKIGRSVGGVVGTLYQAGRDAVDTTIRNVIPFMAFISFIIGIIGYGFWTDHDAAGNVVLKEDGSPSTYGIGTVIARALVNAGLVNSLGGLVIVSIVCAIPILSPLLGPGAVIAQIVGTLLGVEIGKGTIPAQYALPALFAINPQVGCDFIPVGLALGEAEPETVEVGVPAVLFSRLVTGPISVVIAYFFSFGLYTNN